MHYSTVFFKSAIKEAREIYDCSIKFNSDDFYRALVKSGQINGLLIEDNRIIVNKDFANSFAVISIEFFKYVEALIKLFLNDAVFCNDQFLELLNNEQFDDKDGIFDNKCIQNRVNDYFVHLKKCNHICLSFLRINDDFYTDYDLERINIVSSFFAICLFASYKTGYNANYDTVLKECDNTNKEYFELSIQNENNNYDIRANFPLLRELFRFGRRMYKIIEDQLKPYTSGDIIEERMSQNICLHCGGSFKKLFTTKCSVCGIKKDY